MSGPGNREVKGHLRLVTDLPCIRWTGAMSSSGYGTVRVDGKTVGAHVAAYEAVHGPVPRDSKGKRQPLMHTCDHPWCVQVAHLKPGTHRDNAEDRAAKGRSWRQERKAPGTPQGRRYW